MAADANENVEGFLMNHLIDECLPGGDANLATNSDPITGQAAWYDLRVNIAKMSAAALAARAVVLPPQEQEPLRYLAGQVINLHREMKDVLVRK